MLRAVTDSAGPWMVHLVPLAVIWLLAVPLICGRRRAHRRLISTGACRVCSYALAGLPADAPCPECGTGDPELVVVKKKGRLDFRPRRLRALAPLVPLALALPPLMAPAWYLAWRSEGWPAATARRFAFSSPGDALFGSGVAWAIAGVIIARGARVMHRSCRRRAYAAAYIAAILVASATTWFIWERDGTAYYTSAIPATAAAIAACVAALAVWTAEIMTSRAR